MPISEETIHPHREEEDPHAAAADSFLKMLSETYSLESDMHCLNVSSLFGNKPHYDYSTVAAAALGTVQNYFSQDLCRNFCRSIIANVIPQRFIRSDPSSTNDPRSRRRTKRERTHKEEDESIRPTKIVKTFEDKDENTESGEQSIPELKKQDVLLEDENGHELKKPPDDAPNQSPVPPCTIQPINGHHERNNSNTMLHEPTLGCLKHFLRKATLTGYLDESEMEAKMIKNEKIVSQNIRKFVDPCYDDEDDGVIVQKIRQQEELLEVSDQLFDNISFQFQKSLSEPLGDASRRTMTWLRKAVGIRREKSVIETKHGIQGFTQLHQLNPNNDSNKTLTRHQVRSARIRRREEKLAKESQGMDTLFDVVTEFEKEHGPFQPQAKEINEEQATERRMTTRRLTGSLSANTRRKSWIMDEGTEKPQSLIKGSRKPKKAPWTARGTNTKSVEVAIMVNGEFLEQTICIPKRCKEKIDAHTQKPSKKKTVKKVAQPKRKTFKLPPQRHIPISEEQFSSWYTSLNAC